MTTALTPLATNGFAVAVGVFGGRELSALRVEADRLVGRFVEDGFRSDDYWFFEKGAARQPVLYRIHNLEAQGSAPLADLHRDGPLHALAADILLGPVRATASAMIVKMPWLGARVPWHRDRTSVPPAFSYNFSLFLDDSTPDNGCLEFVPGSHLLPDDADVTATHERGPVEAVPVSAGDVAIHDVRAVHSSRPNTSGAWRRSIVVEFAPADSDPDRRDG